MVNAAVKRANRRALDIHGRDITVTNYSFGSENNYGDKPKNQDSEETVKARVDRPRQGDMASDAGGVDHDIDIEIYVKDTVTVTDTPPETEFTVDGHDYVVVIADDQASGLIKASCRRME